MSEYRADQDFAGGGRNQTPFTLYVEGEEYGGWQSMRVTRGLERAVSDFDLQVSERWMLDQEMWQILPGMACEIRFEDELVLTGWVDKYSPSYDGAQHTVRVTGRSKTCDFVDSSANVEGGQFNGMTVGEIAKELARPFTLEVVIEEDGPPEAEVQIQQGETCFALVERLSRLQALLVTDDNLGRLVLCRAGSGQCSTRLEHGRNIKTASADLDDSQRFSDYIVKAQRPGNNSKSADDVRDTDQDWADVVEAPLSRIRQIPNVSDRFLERIRFERALRAGGGGSGKKNPKSLTQVVGSVKDPGITRYRPHVIVAEAQSDDGMAMKRAEWEMRRRIAKALRATISINGWRQQDGRLWTTNEMVSTLAPWLGIDRELVIAQTTFAYDAGGEMTELQLTLPDAFLPDPEKRKCKRAAKEGGRRKGRGKKKGGKAVDPWADVL